MRGLPNPQPSEVLEVPLWAPGSCHAVLCMQQVTLSALSGKTGQSLSGWAGWACSLGMDDASGHHVAGSGVQWTCMLSGYSMV